RDEIQHHSRKAQAPQIGAEESERGGDEEVGEGVVAADRVLDQLEGRGDLAVENLEPEDAVDGVIAPEPGRLEAVKAKEGGDDDDCGEGEGAAASRQLGEIGDLPQVPRPAQERHAGDDESTATGKPTAREEIGAADS